MKIYLACPYTHPNPYVRERRFTRVNLAAGELINSGHIVFSPISQSHPIALACNLPRDFEFWRGYNLSFIEWCDELYVLALDGWKESVGVRAEVEYAEEIGKPVMIWTPNQETAIKPMVAGADREGQEEG